MPTAHREPLCTSAVLPPSPHARGASRRELPHLHRSYWLMRQTVNLLSASVSLVLQVLAGCCKPLLEDGPSRRYLCDLCMGAWVRTPPRSSVAFVRYFPLDIGLSLGSRRSARENNPATQLFAGGILGAATIRLPSGSHTCLAHRLLRRSGHNGPLAAGPHTPGSTRAVTGRKLRHRYVSEPDN